MDKVKIGVIGAGGMGYNHCKTIKNVVEAELTAVCDASAGISEKVGNEFGVKWFTDYKKLIRSKLVDAVTVATPHYFHPEISMFAMNKGLHVISEKPVAVAISSADKMTETALKTNRVFSVMYQRRTNPEVIAAKEIIRSGKLGEIKRTSCFDIWYRSQAYYDSGTWRATWKGEGGGVLINQAPHAIDLFLMLGGMPKKIEAKVRTRLHKIEVEDEASAVMEYENGAWGYYYVTTDEVPEQFCIEIAGDKGKLLLANEKIRFFAAEKSISEYTRSSTSVWESLKAPEKTVILPEVKTGQEAMLENFCRAILYNEPLICPGAEAAKSIEFINAVIYSGIKHKPVEIPLNRKAYDRLLNELKKGSKPKEHVNETRETDPKLL